MHFNKYLCVYTRHLTYKIIFAGSCDCMSWIHQLKTDKQIEKGKLDCKQDIALDWFLRSVESSTPCLKYQITVNLGKSLNSLSLGFYFCKKGLTVPRDISINSLNTYYMS